MLRVVVLVFCCLFSGLTQANIRVLSWNVESGGAELTALSNRLSEFDGYDFYGLSEVQANWADDLLEAIEKDEDINYQSVLGTTGGADRLLLVYNADKYKLISMNELDEINIGGRVRATLVGKFETRSSGAIFKVAVNHLYRSKSNRRHAQAALLNGWIKKQSVPVMLLGDFNFDWDVEDGQNDHDKGYDNLVKGGLAAWVKPNRLVRTQCNLNYNSVLDFVFVSGDFIQGENTSEILFPEHSYCRRNLSRESDHRPVSASIAVDRETNESEIVEQIESIKGALDRLSELLVE